MWRISTSYGAGGVSLLFENSVINWFDYLERKAGRIDTVNRKNVCEDKGDRELYFPEFSRVQTNWIMGCLFHRFLIRPWKRSCMIVYSTSSARRYISLRDYNLQLVHCICLRLISFGYPSYRGVRQDTKKETHLIWVSTYVSTKVLIQDPITTSATGDGTSILCGHPSHANSLSIVWVPVIEPATSHSAVTRSNNWTSPDVVKLRVPHISNASSAW